MISQGIYFHNANSTWLAKKMRECKVSKLQESNFVESQERHHKEYRCQGETLQTFAVPSWICSTSVEFNIRPRWIVFQRILFTKRNSCFKNILNQMRHYFTIIRHYLLFNILLPFYLTIIRYMKTLNYLPLG